MTPLQAARRFELPARHAGVDKKFAAYVADPPPSVERSPGYPRLVAAVYAATLPAAQRTDAAAGCAEELASPVRERGTPDRAMRQGLPSPGGNQEKGNKKQ